MENGIGLALVAQVGVPVTDAPKNAGADPAFWFWPQAIVEKRFGATGALQARGERRLPRPQRERHRLMLD